MLTTDHRSMVEFPGRVMFGVRVMMKALGVSKVVIGVEKNKPDAIAALNAALPEGLDISVLPLTVKYPQGAEKMLIHSVLGSEVPSGKLPISVGVVVQNVGSVAMIGEVFESGLPLVERIVTVTGRGLKRPSNLIVPVGTKLSDLLEFCGGLTTDAAEILFGGPMMGLAVRDLDTPILKGTTGVVVAHDRRRPRAGVVSLHPLRLLSRRLSDVPRPAVFGEPGADRTLRRHGGGASRRLHAVRILFARLPLEHSAQPTVPGRQSRGSAAAGDGRMNPLPRFVVTASPPEGTRLDTGDHVDRRRQPAADRRTAFYFFGISALLVILAATMGAVLAEAGFGSKRTLFDSSGTITGILLGLTLPPGLPLWIAFLGGAIAIAFGKVIFGGLGYNIFNPALLGRRFFRPRSHCR